MDRHQPHTAPSTFTAPQFTAPPVAAPPVAAPPVTAPPCAGLTTERLRLRPFEIRDAEELLALHTDPEVMRYLDDAEPATPQTIEERTLPHLMRHHPCLGGPAYFAVEESQSGRFVGWFELRPVNEGDVSVLELGYRFGRVAWGHGYASEGSTALLHKAFTASGAETVVAETMSVNARSRRVMEKVGMRHVRTFFQEWPHPLPGSEHGEVEYAISREEWTRSRQDPSAARVRP
ncbi:GNAT family N-acetyltransferase [Streptomyces sp. XM4193]|uniref:GNAT family N-acetyltransferase n=1 Tax=Streptomyces sp. XM4193 TaxID=2929782 RepID=UPI001FFBBC30|nr:GNAT family N-acetyltransferase [Streptomyces sp. XM4193]MCK1794685.1 GNAT family N-acetyltransferase [Streptomyces sp. XM4193]